MRFLTIVAFLCSGCATALTCSNGEEYLKVEVPIEAFGFGTSLFATAYKAAVVTGDSKIRRYDYEYDDPDDRVCRKSRRGAL